MLSAQVERRATGHQRLQLGTRSQEVGDKASRGRDMLEIVQDQQDLSAAQRVRELLDQRSTGRLLHGKHPGNTRPDESGLADGREGGEENPIREVLRQISRHFEGETGFAHAPRPGQRD